MKGYYKIKNPDFFKKKVSFYVFWGIAGGLIIIFSVFSLLYIKDLRTETPLPGSGNDTGTKIKEIKEERMNGQETELQKLNAEAQPDRELTAEEKKKIMDEQEKELQALRNLHN